MVIPDFAPMSDDEFVQWLRDNQPALSDPKEEQNNE